MELHFENRIQVNATSVSNEFIDRYMAEANGEYIKVYLYLLRHSGEAVTVVSIADALNHTEADVHRALSYWQKAGVLGLLPEQAEVLGKADSLGKADPLGKAEPVEEDRVTKEVSAACEERIATDQKQSSPTQRSHCTGREMEQLSSDVEFSQLLYIAQKYMNKVFTPADCEVFAYLYSTLHMPTELLEYLVEYCAQNNHTNIRYIEKVALNWHEKKILTVEEAQAYSKSFSKDSFAVMKAFGLTGRSPGEKEYGDIERWFKVYGFSKEMVVAACNRTMDAIHTPSFQYAEQILKDWKQAGVKTQHDIETMDQNRQEQKNREQKEKTARGQGGRKTGTGKTANRFHNLEEHGYDYDKMVWNMIHSGQDSE
ncbi:MAG: DnaD domain protein [Clostridium sp.]